MFVKKLLSLLSAACFIGCSVALYVYAGLGGDSIKGGVLGATNGRNAQ